MSSNDRVYSKTINILSRGRGGGDGDLIGRVWVGLGWVGVGVEDQFCYIYILVDILVYILSRVILPFCPIHKKQSMVLILTRIEMSSKMYTKKRTSSLIR